MAQDPAQPPWRDEKAAGDAAYRAGSMADAIAYYTAALSQLPPPPPPPPPPSAADTAAAEDTEAEALALAAAAATGNLRQVKSLLTRRAAADPDRSVLLSNRAACRIQVGP